MRRHGYFLVTSNGLILSGIHPKKYYVCDPITEQFVQLPPPPMYCKRVSIAILSLDDDEEEFHNTRERRMRCFKVIHAKTNYGPEETTVFIQTFSSSTGKWDQSTLTCSTNFKLYPGVATVARGVVYREATDRNVTCIAAYETKKKNHDNKGRITLIKQPNFDTNVVYGSVFDEYGRQIWFNRYDCYGVSPKGFLQYAACDTTRFHIWVLDDKNFEEDDDQTNFDASIGSNNGWSLCDRVDLDSMWMKNSAALLT